MWNLSLLCLILLRLAEYPVACDGDEGHEIKFFTERRYLMACREESHSWTDCPLEHSHTIDQFFDWLTDNLNNIECGYNGCMCDGFFAPDVTYGYPIQIDWAYDHVTAKPNGCTEVGSSATLPHYQIMLTLPE